MNVRLCAAWLLAICAVPVSGSSGITAPATKYTAAGAAKTLFEILKTRSDPEIAEIAFREKILEQTMDAIFQLARRDRLPQRSAVQLRRAIENFRRSVGLRTYSLFIGTVRQLSSEIPQHLNFDLTLAPFPLVVKKAILSLIQVSPAALIYRPTIPYHKAHFEECDLLNKTSMKASTWNTAQSVSINITRNIFLFIPFSLILAADLAISDVGIRPLALLVDQISKNPVLITATIFPNLFYVSLLINFLSPKKPPRNSCAEILVFLSSILFHLYADREMDPERAKLEDFSPLGVIEMLLGMKEHVEFLSDKERKLLSSIRKWGKETAQNIKKIFKLSWLSEREYRLTVQNIAEFLFALCEKNSVQLPPGGHRHISILSSVLSVSSPSPAVRNHTATDLPLATWAEFAAPAILTALHDVTSLENGGKP